jgi:hypothetical protein
MGTKTIKLRTKRIIKEMTVTSAGEIKADELALPNGCAFVAGITGLIRKSKQPDHDPIFTDTYYYFGVGAVKDESTIDFPFVATLDRLRYKADEFDALADPIVSEHIYYAYPNTKTKPVFTFNNTTGGFVDIGEVLDSQTNITFRVFVSTNANLGETTVNISH